MVYKFFNTCEGWNPNDVYKKGGLVDMIDNAISITRRTFLKHVGVSQMKPIERELGYDNNLRMSSDYYVSYHRSTLHGKRCYFFKWSGIEHVFVQCENL